MSNQATEWDEDSNTRVEYALEEFHKARLSDAPWDEAIETGVASYNLSKAERVELLRRLG